MFSLKNRTSSRRDRKSDIKIGSNFYEKVKIFKYLGSLVTNQNSIQDGIIFRLKAENSC